MKNHLFFSKSSANDVKLKKKLFNNNFQLLMKKLKIFSKFNSYDIQLFNKSLLFNIYKDSKHS